MHMSRLLSGALAVALAVAVVLIVLLWPSRVPSRYHAGTARYRPVPAVVTKHVTKVVPHPRVHFDVTTAVPADPTIQPSSSTINSWFADCVKQAATDTAREWAAVQATFSCPTKAEIAKTLHDQKQAG